MLMAYKIKATHNITMKITYYMNSIQKAPLLLNNVGHSAPLQQG